MKNKASSANFIGYKTLNGETHKMPQKIVDRLSNAFIEIIGKIEIEHNIETDDNA